MRRTTVALAGLLTVGAAALAFERLDGGEPATRTAAGTTIAGRPAGGLDTFELTALLNEMPSPAAIKVTMGSVAVSVQPSELGARIDVPATVAKALRDSGESSRLFGLIDDDGEAVDPVLELDRNVRERTVAKLLRAGARPESHGDLGYSGGEVRTRAPATGQEISPEDAERALDDATRQQPLPDRVTIEVRRIPSHVTPARLSELALQARGILRPGLEISAGDRVGRLSPDRLGPLLTVEGDGGLGDGKVDLALRSTAAQQLVQPLVDELSVEPREPRVSAPPPTPALENTGDASWQPVPVTTKLATGGAAGQSVSAAAVTAALERLLRQPDVADTLLVGPTPVQPRSSDAQARAVNSVLGTFTSSFSCCQGRVTNIRLIAKTVDGTLIGPGQSFSLNGVVGPRTRAKGYVEAPFILDGELSTDVGGGVSQFATTMLNAAFFAGLRLDEHQAHSFYISRYPAGREATVNYPGIDLVWTNTTAASVLVRTSSTPTSVTVALYGADDGRSVSGLSGPRRAVSGRDFRITITRTVTIPGQPPRRDRYTTTYNRPPDE